ncbi:MAG: LolA family protein [Actinomycetota bacterium]
MTRTRTLVVAGLGMVVLVVAAASVAARPSPSPNLPPISPEGLVTSTLRALARDRPVSGHLTAHLDLGLPALPDVAPGPVGTDAASFLASLSGDHRLRLWSSPDGFRLAELRRASERAIFVSRTDAWAWDFDSFTAYHLGRFPQGIGSPGHHGTGSMLDLVDPLAWTRKALDAITPTTRVSAGETTRVAGRDAYVLALEPRTAETLVRRIEIDIDAERRLPLRVAVYSRARRAAPISVGFTSISFDDIDPSTFRFTPPPGATVRDISREFADGKGRKGQGIEGSSRDAYGPGEDNQGAPVRLFGDDWATIVALRTPPPADLRRSGEEFDPTSLLPLSGPLLSVRLVERGDHAWLVYGLVPQASLAAASRELP